MTRGAMLGESLSSTLSGDDRKLLFENGLGVLVDQTGASWNQHWHWLNRLDQIRSSALAT